MPESRKRKKAVYTEPTRRAAPKGPSPVWLAPLMLAPFLVGIAWLVVFYVAEQSMPLTGHLGNANLLIGFGFIILGFLVSTQWR